MSGQTTIASRWISRTPADKYTVWLVLMLTAAGVVAVYSAISFLAETKADGDTERFLFKHVARALAGLGVMALFSVINYRTLARFSRLALLLAMGLLVAVQVVGVTSGGAERWLSLGAVGFQPSDLAKVAIILYIAVLLTRKQFYIESLGKAFVPMLLWILPAILLIGMEDLSTAAVVLVATCLMCFVGRVRILHLAGTGALALLLMWLLLMASPHRAERLESFVGVKLFPHTRHAEVFDAQAEGYQARQARIAIAMGGVSGVGPGKSVQRDFLPAPYNDFIFAIIAEEYGLVGAIALLALFVGLLFRGFMRIARHAPDPLGLLLAVGYTTVIVLFGTVHAGVACGLLPVTGLPMPFVSYGGTSMVATGAMVGILLNISRESRP